LLGVCQFTNRAVALARLYADAFAAAPLLAEDIRFGHRFNAARAAAVAGWGQGEGASLSQEEQTRWREQARQWLRADLAAWGKVLDSGGAGHRAVVRQRLMSWCADPDLAGLREPRALDRLPPAERQKWRSLWSDVDALLERARKVE